MNGIGSSSHFPSSANGETWGDSSNSLYATRNLGTSTAESSPTNNSKQPFHLHNHFDFDQLKSSTNVNVGNSDPINRIGAESVPPGLGLFPSDTTSGTKDNTNSFHDKPFDVMQIGSRRPASTGVIGHNHVITSTSSSVMESLGLISPDSNHSYSRDTSNDVTGSAAAIAVTTNAMTKRKQQKPIMDLIQEDFEKPPSPQYQREDHLSGAGGAAAVVAAARSKESGSNITNAHTPISTTAALSAVPSSLPMGSSHSSSAQLNFVTGTTNNFEDNVNVSFTKRKRKMSIYYLLLASH